MRMKRKKAGIHGQSDSFGNPSNSSGFIIEVKTFQQNDYSILFNATSMLLLLYSLTARNNACKQCKTIIEAAYDIYNDNYTIDNSV